MHVCPNIVKHFPPIPTLSGQHSRRRSGLIVSCVWFSLRQRLIPGIHPRTRSCGKFEAEAYRPAAVMAVLVARTCGPQRTRLVHVFIFCINFRSWSQWKKSHLRFIVICATQPTSFFDVGWYNHDMILLCRCCKQVDEEQQSKTQLLEEHAEYLSVAILIKRAPAPFAKSLGSRLPLHHHHGASRRYNVFPSR